MSTQTPLMRRGEVVDFLRDTYGLKEHYIRTLFEEKVIKPAKKLYKSQKQAYYSRAQILKDVVQPMGLVEISNNNRDSQSAGSAEGTTRKGQS